MDNKFLELDLRLHEVRKMMHEREHILSIMASIDAQLHIAETNLFKSRNRLKHERNDLEKLENISFESLFYKLLGLYNTQIEKETDEYLSAKMAVQMCELQIASLNSRLHELEGMLVKLANCDEEYEQLKQEQAEILTELQNPKSDRLKALSTDLALKAGQAKEIAEAIDMGKQALDGIEAVITILERGRSRNDTWNLSYSFSGSSDPVGQAIEIALKTQPMLDRFQLELTDISQQFSATPDMKMPKKPDFMFVQVTRGLSGNRFTDISAQPNIKQWFIHLQQLRPKIAIRLTLLEKQLVPLRDSLILLEKEKNDLISELWHSSISEDSL